MKREFLLKLDELEILARELPKEGIILLNGALASGKTTLTQAIAKFRGVRSGVTSPTFSVMQSYECADGGKIYHYDIYQNGVSGFIKNGLFENLFEEGLHIAEWGDSELEALLTRYGVKFYKINISLEGDARKYEVISA